MASKRMFSKKVIESDEFLSMSTGSQMLYIHLCMFADDFGFFNNVKSVMRSCNASEDDFRLLIIHSFVVQVDKELCNGILFYIKHWHVHNSVDKSKCSNIICPEIERNIIMDGNREYIRIADCEKILLQLQESEKNDHDNSDSSCNVQKVTKTGQLVPTVEEIETECKEIGYPTYKAKEFYQYFDANGWEMRDSWQQVLLRWKMREDKKYKVSSAEIITANRGLKNI